MARKKFCVLFVLLFLILPPFSAAAGNDRVVLYFFWGDGCPHCLAAKPFLKQMQEKYPLDIREFETWHNRKNAELFANVSELCGVKGAGVPAFFIGERVIVGFNETYAPLIEEEIKRCVVSKECPDPVQNLICKEPSVPGLIDDKRLLRVPGWGEVDTRRLSLPLFTVIIGLLDGFNPCAMWVLSFLLTLIIYAHSRKRILLVGGIFVVTSGLVYFLFMSAWLNLFLVIGYADAVRILIGIAAIAAGIVNVKDFFMFGKGFSLTIPDHYKPGLIARMRALVTMKKNVGLIFGTITLALFANLVEVLCTSGFPAIYTRVLTLRKMPTVTYYAYLGLYNIIYIVPLAVIVAAFAITMGRRKLSEKEGRILKLAGGILMCVLGSVLLLKPGLLFF